MSVIIDIIRKLREPKRLYALLELYSVYLIYIFALLLFLNPFIILFFGNPDATVYKVKRGNSEIVSPWINFAALPDYMQPKDYNEITEREEQYLQQKNNAIQWLGFTALLGWCSTHPKFKTGIQRLIKELKKI